MFIFQIQTPSKSSILAVFAVFRARVPIQDLKTSMMEETSADGFRVFSRFIFRVWQILSKQLEFVCLCWCFSVQYWHNMLVLRTEFGIHPSAVQIHPPKSGLITWNVFAMIGTWDLSKIRTKVDVTVPWMGTLGKKIRSESLFSNCYCIGLHIYDLKGRLFLIFGIRKANNNSMFQFDSIPGGNQLVKIYSSWIHDDSWRTFLPSLGTVISSPSRFWRKFARSDGKQLRGFKWMQLEKYISI